MGMPREATAAPLLENDFGIAPEFSTNDRSHGQLQTIEHRQYDFSPEFPIVLANIHPEQSAATHFAGPKPGMGGRLVLGSGG